MAVHSRFDPQAFRAALSTSTTGVTLITASFNSVSLNPPMLLWSLAKNVRSLPIFNEGRHCNVHVLSTDQKTLVMQS